MIAKEKTRQPKLNRREIAGDKAERQMAFYLKRTFSENPATQVFNDLRIERNGEVAQIDHLLLHEHGFVIIESKSVTGEVHINEYLEFARVFNGKKTGMPSPIQQAQRQGSLLRALLNDHKEKLRKKKLLRLVQGGFQHCPIQVLVAISDQGIIKRPRVPIPELHKADQITDQVQAVIARHTKASKLTAAVDGDWGLYTFHPEELGFVTEFLLFHHIPSKQKAVPSATSNSEVNAPLPTMLQPKHLPVYLCTHCQSTNLQIRYARSYYFKCLDCDGNTAIKNTCPSCNQVMRTKKRGEVFSAICTTCNSQKVFFTNKSESPTR